MSFIDRTFTSRREIESPSLLGSWLNVGLCVRPTHFDNVQKVTIGMLQRSVARVSSILTATRVVDVHGTVGRRKFLKKFFDQS